MSLVKIFPLPARQVDIVCSAVNNNLFLLIASRHIAPVTTSSSPVCVFRTLEYQLPGACSFDTSWNNPVFHLLNTSRHSSHSTEGGSIALFLTSKSLLVLALPHSRVAGNELIFAELSISRSPQVWTPKTTGIMQTNHQSFTMEKGSNLWHRSGQ